MSESKFYNNKFTKLVLALSDSAKIELSKKLRIEKNQLEIDTLKKLKKDQIKKQIKLIETKLHELKPKKANKKRIEHFKHRVELLRAKL